MAQGDRMILLCGEALIDLVPVVADGELAYAPRTGGSPYNVALGLGRLGFLVGFFGRVSSDPFGQSLRSRLVAEGVDCRLLRQGDEPTALAIVHLPPSQEPVFVFYGDGSADCTLTGDDLPSPEELGATTALHFGSISLVREPGATAYEQLMRRESGRRVISLDPNVRPGLIGDRAAYRRRLEGWVAMADIVKVSQADLAWLYPDRAPVDAARDLLAAGPSLVVVTRGAAGAVGITALATVDVPGTPVVVRDTVGAGDAFTAGLLGFLALRGVLDRAALRSLGEEDLRPCLVLANRAASITCTRSGAQPPTRAEVVSEP
jgi:fructokinase